MLIRQVRPKFAQLSFRRPSWSAPTSAHNVGEPDFFIAAQDFEPAYLELYRTGELQRRSREAVEGLARCQVCPRRCQADRLAGELGVCRVGRYARVSSSFAHHGEEDCLRGWGGSFQ